MTKRQELFVVIVILIVCLTIAISMRLAWGLPYIPIFCGLVITIVLIGKWYEDGE